MSRRHSRRPRIAKPIPMKRELKRNMEWNYYPYRIHCKAYPDEKGIETCSPDLGTESILELQSLSRWKGNWNAHRPPPGREGIPDCKAYPDEKGIETPQPPTVRQHLWPVLQSLSRWKGNSNTKSEATTDEPNNPNCVSSQDRIPSYSPHQPILAFYHRLHGLVLYSLTAWTVSIELKQAIDLHLVVYLQ